MKNSLNALNSVAEKFAWTNDYGEEAAEINLRILELNSQSDDAYMRLAYCSLAERNYVEAKQLCQSALKINPKNRTAGGFIVKIKNELETERQAMALGDWQESLDKGKVNQQNKQTSVAIVYYWQAVQLSNNLEEFLESSLQLASAYQERHEPADLDLAEAIYNEILQLAPENEQSNAGLVALIKDKHKLGEARKLVKKVLHQQQLTNPPVWNGKNDEEPEISNGKFTRFYAIHNWQKKKEQLVQAKTV